jgi:hypothetical protein
MDWDNNSRLMTLYHWQDGRGYIRFLLEQTLPVDMGLLTLHVLLPKYLSVNSQNTLSTTMVFHTVLLLIKELTAW